MDKYEYKVRSDEMKSLIAQGNYAQAAEIADTIDWRRVKSVMMLCTVSDVYKINRRYEDAKNMLLLAYERRPGGRTICYSLCELCIKTEEFVQALNYYKEFVQAAPRDTGRFILQYKLYEAQEVSLEERIGVLEELKKRDYREKWAYELAYLYHRVGLATRCVEECDELILWFGEGKYVVKAMELKMLHQPLTPAQQEAYDRRFEEELPPEQGNQEIYEEEADYGEPAEGQESYGWPSEEERPGEDMQGHLPDNGASGQDGEELDIQVKTMDVGKYNTINLQAELAAGLQEVLGADGTVQRSPAAGEPGLEDAGMEGMPEEAGYQDYEEEEIEDSEVFFGATGELEDASLELEEDGAGPGYEAVEELGYDPQQGGIEGQAYALEQEAVEGPGYDLGQEAVEELDYDLGQEAVEGQGYDLGQEAVEGQGYDLGQEAVEGSGYDLGQEAVEGQGYDLGQEAVEGSGYDLGQEAVEGSGYDLGQEAVEGQGYDLGQEAVEGPGYDLGQEAVEGPDYDLGQEAVEGPGYDIQQGGEEEQSLALRSAGGREPEWREETKGSEASRAEAKASGDAALTGEAAVQDAEPSRNGQNLMSGIQPPKEMAEVLSQEANGQISLVLPESTAVEKQITGQMKIDDILVEWERIKKENEARCQEEVRQHVLSQTGPMFTEFEANVRDGLLEQLEKGEAQQSGEENADGPEAALPDSEAPDAEPVDPEQAGPQQDMPGGEAAAPPAAEAEEEPEYIEGDSAVGLEYISEEDLPEEDFIESAEYPEAGYEAEACAEDGPDYPEEAGYGQVGYEDAAYAGDELDYLEEAEFEAEPEEAAEPEFQDELDGTEADDIIEEIEEIQEQVEKAGEKAQPVRGGRTKTPETGKNAENDDKPEKPSIERDQAKVRSLTREEKELYAPFIQNRRSREQLVKALDSISMAAYTGNLVITGEEGMDTLTLAKNIMRELRMMDSNFAGKVAKVSGQGLNEKDVAQTLEQLGNGALIIQKASGMTPETAATLHRKLQHERFGIIVVLEDTGKAMKKLFLGTPDLYGDFTARIDLEALSNDALVAFGRQYAREKEFSIDNLGILALHTRIEEMQTIDHVVTVMEVKQIVDEAIRHASRKTLGHFFDVLLAKRYDDEDMIILTEKDFVA